MRQRISRAEQRASSLGGKEGRGEAGRRPSGALQGLVRTASRVCPGSQWPGGHGEEDLKDPGMEESSVWISKSWRTAGAGNQELWSAENEGK